MKLTTDDPFEAWCKKRYPLLSLAKHNGAYDCKIVSMLHSAFMGGIWSVWQKQIKRVGMKLPNDVSRCNGATVNNAMQAVECGLRDRCERYLQKDTGDKQTPFSHWLCGETPKYFIEVSNEPIPTQG